MSTTQIPTARMNRFNRMLSDYLRARHIAGTTRVGSAPARRAELRMANIILAAESEGFVAELCEAINATTYEA